MSEKCICEKTKENGMGFTATLYCEPPCWVLAGFNTSGSASEVVVPLAEFCPWCGGSLKGGAENE